MVCSTLPVNVLAVESSDQNVGGLCEHHTEHNADCGYTEGIEGTPCNHEHTEDCYTLVTSCVHKHTADCYPAESGVVDTAPRLFLLRDKVALLTKSRNSPRGML